MHLQAQQQQQRCWQQQCQQVTPALPAVPLLRQQQPRSCRRHRGLTLDSVGVSARQQQHSSSRMVVASAAPFTSSNGAAAPAVDAAASSSTASLASANPLLSVPISVLTDSYKASHFLQYPAADKLVAYGEFRTGFNSDAADTRLVVFGVRYVLENYVLRRWTREDVDRAALFYSTHLAPAYGAFPFPKDLFMRFVTENSGYFPVKIQALREGTCVHAHTPVYQITASGEYSALCTYLETLLTMMWYPATVATLSRRARDTIEAAFAASVDGGAYSPLLPSRLHDFGFRGCTSVEQSVLGGCAHLLSFEGTDTLSAAYYAQFHLNGGRPVAMSIPATEHSVMTCWPTEAGAILNMIDNFGTGIFATVMDSYDYTAALNEVVPVVAEAKQAAGGFWVLRPDSGDPVEVVLMALRALERVFGATPNAKGFKVINGAGVIQGDGINITTLGAILDAVGQAGYSAECVAFGMGGGLLQRVNRDTMSFATKLCHVVYAGGAAQDVMKHPATDQGKISLPGVLAVKRVRGVPTVFPADSGDVAPGEDLLQMIYDHGPVQGMVWDDFDTLRARVAREWDALPKNADNISAPLRAKVAALRTDTHGLRGGGGEGGGSAAAATVAAAAANGSTP